MNYRHTYHAGNFADVLKHAALVAALTGLRETDAPFAVTDSHAGRGIYDLKSEESRKTGEAEGGIARLLREATLPGVLAHYSEIVRGAGRDRYPGSPLIAAALLRPKDRLVAIEKHPDEASHLTDLTEVLGGHKHVRVIHGDGYAELARALPPPEGRGLVLIDPPFEEPGEFRKAAAALVQAWNRFPEGAYLFWYPAKEKPALAATVGELLNAGVRPVFKLELDIGAGARPQIEGRGPPLTAAGLLALNPPVNFEKEMGAILAFLVEKLAQGPGARAALDTVAD